MAKKVKATKKTTDTNLVISSEVFPDQLPIFPVSDRPIFPGMVVPLIFSRSLKPETFEYIKKKKNSQVGIILLSKKYTEEKDQIDPFDIHMSLDDLRPVGCVGKILKAVPSPTNEMQVLLNAQRRFTIESIDKNSPILLAKVKYYEPPKKLDKDIPTYVAALIAKIKDLIKLNSIFSEEMKIFITRYGSDNPDKLTDMVASMLSTISTDEMQDILETFDLTERVTKVLHYIHKEVEVSRLKEKINKQIEEKISKQQRDFFLQEQLKSIKKELGMEKDEKTSDTEKIIEKIKKLKLTDEAKKVVEEELEKLKIYDVRSSEYGVSRNYIQWITSLPWGVTTEDNLILDNVLRTLNRDHYGLSEVKDRIMEFVAIQKLKKKIGGSILCFVGPPGVGKTSLGKSIAHALERKFYNFSLGGIRDDAEIKGHRRTYIGAMPGKIIQALKTVGSSNPVIMMDEIDKIHASHQGDPASALLEVLDPEQNTNFLDHYLDLRFDLSQILFIATANSLETIPAPLLDRMEIIRLSGYILEEKRQIAKRFVIPKQLIAHGMIKKDIDFTSKGLDTLIKHYARESGVRSLENEIKKILRKAAVEISRNIDAPSKKKKSSKKGIQINENNVKNYLGTEKFKEDAPYLTINPGIVTGLAWTSMGGTTLYIESIVVQKEKNKGGIKVTGQLGSVMKESTGVAHSFASSIAEKYGIDPNFFNDAFIHMHVPAGATPKDGPSAGITMCLSLISLGKNVPVPSDIAMTGELTVSGYVLPIGGLREKLVAAKRIGKKKVIFPEENKKDFDELPAHLKKGIKVFFVTRFEDLLQIIFPQKKRAKSKRRKS